MPKVCTKCHQSKELSEFSRDRKAPDGHSWYCKACLRAYSKTRYVADPGKMRATSQQYREKNREKVNASVRVYYQAHRQERLAYAKAYSTTNPEKIKTRKKAYKAKSIDKIRAYRQATRARDRIKQRERYRKNPEYYRQKMARIRAAHPDRYREYVERRRARKLAAPQNDLTSAQWREIKIAYRQRCVYCGRKMQRLEMDHIIPLSKGGSHTVSNIVPACRSCNASKGDRAVLVPVQPLLLTIAEKRNQPKISSPRLL